MSLLNDGVNDANREFEATVAIAMETAGPTDGRLEVARSIAATSLKVTVDPNTVPFTTVPSNLFDLTFGDPNVGITTESLMRAFKAHLKKDLKQIKQEIEASIPPNPALRIELVAQFVFAALNQDDEQ